VGLRVETDGACLLGYAVGPVHFGLDRPKVGLHGAPTVHRGISAFEARPLGGGFPTAQWLLGTRPSSPARQSCRPRPPRLSGSGEAIYSAFPPLTGSTR
jgi:hypothetical protein